MAETITPTILADHLQITPKECRKFLRSMTSARAGKGGRWAIDIRDLEAIVARYEVYLTTKTVSFELED